MTRPVQPPLVTLEGGFTIHEADNFHGSWQKHYVVRPPEFAVNFSLNEAEMSQARLGSDTLMRTKALEAIEKLKVAMWQATRHTI